MQSIYIKSSKHIYKNLRFFFKILKRKCNTGICKVIKEHDIKRKDEIFIPGSL